MSLARLLGQWTSATDRWLGAEPQPQ